MMKIKYKFATGEVAEFEVEDTLAKVMIQIERNEYSSNRKETRRHESYSDDNDKRESLVDRSMNIEQITEWGATKENLYFAILQLNAHQQKLIQMIFFLGLSETESADIMGVSQQAISKQLKVIYKNLKNFLK